MLKDLIPKLSQYMFQELCKKVYGTAPSIKNAPRNWEIVAPTRAWDTWYRLHRKEK